MCILLHLRPAHWYRNSQFLLNLNAFYRMHIKVEYWFIQLFLDLQYLQSLPYVSTFNAFHIMQIEMPYLIIFSGFSVVDGVSWCRKLSQSLKSLKSLNFIKSKTESVSRPHVYYFSTVIKSLSNFKWNFNIKLAFYCRISYYCSRKKKI